MDDREFEKAVYWYLVVEKSYPQSELQIEAALGQGEGQSFRVDLAITDSRRSEFVALIEIKSSREHKALRSAVSQLLQYRRVLGKSYVPLYLFFPASPGSHRRFDISQVLPNGDTREIYPEEFPAYDALVSGDKSSKKATRTATVKATVDTFKIVCICLSLLAALLLCLDVADIVQLSIKQLSLAGISGALLVLPYATKLKMLGIEFERHTPNQAPRDEP